MGLFDSLFSDNPNDAAYLALASGLLGGKGSFNSILGNSLVGAQGAYSGAADRGLKNQMTKMQIEEMARKLKAQQQQDADQEAFRQKAINLGSPQMRSVQAALAGGGGPTVENAEKIQPVDPVSQLLFDAMVTRQATPLQYAQSMQKDRTPQKVGAGEKVYSHDFKTLLAENPKDGSEDRDVALLKKLYGEGTPEYMAGMRQLVAKRTTHQPPVSLNNYGSPLPVALPGGGTGYIQPPTKPGGPSQILNVPGTNTPAKKPDEQKDKDPTEFQAKAGLYFKSMSQASQTLKKLDGTKAAVPTVAETVVPHQDIKTVIRDNGRQQYVQAARQWLDSINRVRSGAQLPEIEYDRGMRTYFPTFGETSPAVQRQKAKARAEEETFLQSAAGRALPQNAPKAVEPPAENDDPLGLRSGR